MTAIASDVVSRESSRKTLTALATELSPLFASRADEHDRTGSFVADNYEELKAHRFFSALVPVELGGGGASMAEISDVLRFLAHADSSTALSLSMHSHLVATVTWKWRNAQGPDAVLRKIAEHQLVLVSTGANDWLESSGSLEKVDGGYRFNAIKPFASGSVVGDFAVTSAVFKDPVQGERVLHFAASIKSQGVKILDDWHTLGMRGTGSNSMKFENVFIPDAAITLDRPRGYFHGFYNVVLTNAMPPIMAVYLGIAEEARDTALAILKKSARPDELAWQLIGEIENELTICRLAANDMVALADDPGFVPSVELTNQIVIRKTIVANSAIAVVRKAMEAAGGKSYYRSAKLERLMRDVLAAQFHPLQEKPQHRFTGRVCMGLDPIRDREYQPNVNPGRRVS